MNVKTIVTMKEVIEALAKKWGFDLKKPGNCLELELIGYQPLAIEVVGYRQISVMHYFLQNGDVMRDPEIVFFQSDDFDWTPLEHTQDGLGIYTIIAQTIDGELREIIDLVDLFELKELGQIWAENLKNQGWLENAIERKKS